MSAQPEWRIALAQMDVSARMGVFHFETNQTRCRGYRIRWPSGERGQVQLMTVEHRANLYGGTMDLGELKHVIVRGFYEIDQRLTWLMELARRMKRGRGNFNRMVPMPDSKSITRKAQRVASLRASRGPPFSA